MTGQANRWRKTEHGFQQGGLEVLRLLVIRPSRGKRRRDRGKTVTDVAWVAVVDRRIVGRYGRLRDAKDAAALAAFLSPRRAA